MRYVFLDIETTGLDRQRDEVWEVGVVVDHIGTGLVPSEHVFRFQPSTAAVMNMTPEAREVNGWNERTHDTSWLWDYPSNGGFNLHGLLLDATLVAANPDFDCHFLRTFFQTHLPHLDPEPWHHRKLDVESMFFQHVWQSAWPPAHPESARPDGMRQMREHFELPEPTPHTALQDARDVRELFTRLLDWP